MHAEARVGGELGEFAVFLLRTAQLVLGQAIPRHWFSGGKKVEVRECPHGFRKAQLHDRFVGRRRDSHRHARSADQETTALDQAPSAASPRRTDQVGNCRWRPDREFFRRHGNTHRTQEPHGRSDPLEMSSVPLKRAPGRLLGRLRMRGQLVGGLQLLRGSYLGAKMTAVEFAA